MSRVGKTPVEIPDGVKIEVSGNNLVKVRGPKGELEKKLPEMINVKIEDSTVIFEPDSDSKEVSAMWGLARSLVNGMVEGVTDGFKKTLEVRGREYKVSLKGKNLELDLGYSHNITVEPKGEVSFEVNDNKIIVSGIDKEIVGEQAAEIRDLRPPEVYKGKGIRYEGEYVIQKEGKRGL